MANRELTHRTITFVVATLVLCTLTEPSSCWGSETLIAAAKKRSEVTQTIRIEYHLSELCTKGSISHSSDPVLSMMTLGEKAKVIPQIDTKLESDNVLIFHRGKVRLEQNHPLWHMPDGVLIQKPRLDVSDGSICKSYYDQGIGRTAVKTGIINNQLLPRDLKVRDILSLIVNLRGADTDICPLKLADAKPLGRQDTIADHACEVLSIRRDQITEWRLWADPQCDYAIRKVQRLQSDRVTYQIETSLKHYDNVGWIPSSWTYSEFGSEGQVLKSIEGVITKIAFDVKPTDDQFEIAFPEGTHVFDQRTSKDYRVLADGSLREITPMDQDIIEEIALTPPEAAWHVRNRWPLIIVLAVISLTVIVLYLARRKSPGLTES